MSMFHELMMKKKGMPSRYQEVEYIESTGTQYIDTGVMADDTTGLNIEVQSLLSSDRILIGSRVVGTDSRFYIGSTANYYIGWNVYNTIGIPYSQKSQISLNFYNDRSVYGDGVLKQNISGTLATQNSNIIIFGVNSSGSATALSSCKMYKVQISKGNRLVRNFIPVYDTLTQKYGMWESVQGKFYGNDGTGDFKGSIVGYTVVGSPTITDGVVSGFSNSNYLQINSGISVGQNFEIYTKFTTGASLSSNQELIAGKKSSDLYLRIFIQNGATLFTSARVVGASSISHNQTSYSFQTNTTYFVKVKYDGANKLDVFIYDNTGQQVKTNSFTLSNQINTFNSLLIGTVGTPSSVWGGSIDLNETYIKVNGKLWFNGQQA